jgi:hypothetical protein
MMTPLDDALGGNRKPNLVAVSVDSLSDSRILRASERSRRDYLLGNAHPPTTLYLIGYRLKLESY